MRSPRAVTGFLGVILCLPFRAACAGPPTYTTLYNFTGLGGDGSGPVGGLALGHDGVLYGTTVAGGTGPCDGGCGTVFQLVPPQAEGGSWSETVLYSFMGQQGEGASPGAPLSIDSHGVLFGTTSAGGAISANCSVGCGTVFRLAPPQTAGGPWTETVLYSFAGGNDGAVPYSGVTIGSGGALYGTTYSGGAAKFGTAFELSQPSAPGGSWAEAVLYSFDYSFGANPSTGLVIGQHGTLYGAAATGGSNKWGSIFALEPPATRGGAWTAAVVHAFGLNDGGGPDGLSIDRNGALYGTTTTGGPGSCPGPGGCGTVFQLRPPASPGEAWVETVLEGSAWGPIGGVAFGASGLLYSMSAASGACLFSLVPPPTPGASWMTTALHYFSGGFTPEGSLLIGRAKVLYGVVSGGPHTEGCPVGCGAVFAVTP